MKYFYIFHFSTPEPANYREDQVPSRRISPIYDAGHLFHQSHFQTVNYFWLFWIFLAEVSVHLPLLRHQAAASLQLPGEIKAWEYFYPSFQWIADGWKRQTWETKKTQPNWVREIWWFIQTHGKRNERDLVLYLAVKQVNNVQVTNLDKSAGNWTSSCTETVTN